MLRLKGTNSEEAKKIVQEREKEFGLIFEQDFDTAAQKVVK